MVSAPDPWPANRVEIALLWKGQFCPGRFQDAKLGVLKSQHKSGSNFEARQAIWSNADIRTADREPAY